MIELTLKQYVDKVEAESVRKLLTEHVYEGDTLFVFFFMSYEKWQYFTTVKKSDIEDIMSFKIDRCNGCMIVKESPVWVNDFEDEKGTISANPEPTITTKGVTLVDIEEIVDMSENYADFLVNLFDRFGAEVLRSVNKIQTEKMLKKTFGEFVSILFNTVNTAQFAKEVKRFLKIDVEFGRKEAEKELGVDIPYNEAFEQKLAVLYNEQISGYTINGKKWFGIKGVTKEIQQKVIAVVQGGISENKTNAEIAKDVKTTFDGFTDWRSNMIARTETNRIINESLIVGYKESGLEGGKGIKVAIDDRTSPICVRLFHKYKDNVIGLDEQFIDDEGADATMKAWDNPAFHPFCRTRVFFRPN